jgi:competence protein ComEA
MEERRGFDWREIWPKFKAPVILGLIGLILVGVGTFSVLFLRQKESVVEIIPLEETATGSALFVDLQGAVENPGLYELPAGARVSDLLTEAGGLSAEADEEWVEKNLNLAQKLVDGIKVYIPQQGEEAPLAPQSTVDQVAGSSASLTDKVNLNTASAAQLDSLWGIGAKRAADIIASRPFQSIEELKTKKLVPSNVYERIKDQVAVY